MRTRSRNHAEKEIPPQRPPFHLGEDSARCDPQGLGSPDRPRRRAPRQRCRSTPCAGDTGSDIEDYGIEDADPAALAERDPEEILEEGPPYAGSSGGAVGGSPAEGRSTGGRTEGGIAPGGVHRGDSTIGADPESDAE